jgi:hypothetical protein
VAPTHRQWPQLVPDPKVDKVENESARGAEPPIVDPDSACAPAAACAAVPAATAESGTDAAIGRFRDAVESITEVAAESITETPPPRAERPPDSTADSSLPADSNARAAPPPLRRVVAEEFVLVDSHGERRATLTLEDGAAALSLCDANGGVRAAIRLSIDGAPSVVFYDTSGRRRLEVALRPDGAAGLGLYDERGEGRAEVVVSGSGAPSVSLYGPSGKRLARMPAPRER